MTGTWMELFPACWPATPAVPPPGISGAGSNKALVQLGWEGRRRVRVAAELGIDADPDAVDPRLLIVLERVNRPPGAVGPLLGQAPRTPAAAPATPARSAFS
ncbi:hypothetical protein AB0N14_29065 [Streptomyces sp. NPDC051104]|uniref:hypothetical protein n=1 Tax=Streptomyces sp. NPDC051104 TaxID=3155044 RepID=UPI00341F2A54